MRNGLCFSSLWGWGGVGGDLVAESDVESERERRRASPREFLSSTPLLFFLLLFFKRIFFSLLHNFAMENVPVVSAAALPQQQAHAWETVKENFKPLKKGRKPEELAPEVAPLGPACTAPPGAEEERRCVLSGVFF